MRADRLEGTDRELVTPLCCRNFGLGHHLIRFLAFFSQASGWDSADLSWTLSDGFLQPSSTSHHRYRTPDFLFVPPLNKAMELTEGHWLGGRLTPG